MSWAFLDKPFERVDPAPRYGAEPLTPERLQEIRDYLTGCGQNDRNDPESFAVLNYVEDLLAEIDRLDVANAKNGYPLRGPRTLAQGPSA